MNSEAGPSRHFMVVDDDPISNMVCEHAIGKVFTAPDITLFTEPKTALDIIRQEYRIPGSGIFPVILFLDINMPSMSGWEFLDEFEAFGQEIHNKFTIYMLSSSVDFFDKERAKANHLISGFISKPMTADNLKSLLDNSL